MFDNISHEWIQENILMDKTVLKKFLKLEYIYQNNFYKTKSGVVQGGVLIANGVPSCSTLALRSFRPHPLLLAHFHFSCLCFQSSVDTILRI